MYATYRLASSFRSTPRNIGDDQAGRLYQQSIAVRSSAFGTVFMPWVMVGSLILSIASASLLIMSLHDEVTTSFVLSACMSLGFAGMLWIAMLKAEIDRVHRLTMPMAETLRNECKEALALCKEYPGVAKYRDGILEAGHTLRLLHLFRMRDIADEADEEKVQADRVNACRELHHAVQT